MRRIAVLLVIFSFAFTAQSQGIRMGLSASPQFSWMTSDAGNTDNDGAVLGFNFGLMTDFFFAERYSLSTGVLINNTGGTLMYNDSIRLNTSDDLYDFGEETSIRYHIQYIDVPLAFKLESNQIGYFVYWAQFGVTNHIRVGSSADIESQDINGVGIKDEINLFSMGYNVGGGMNYYFSKNTAITVGVVYNNGFIDITNNKGKRNDDTVSLKSLQVKFGFIF